MVKKGIVALSILSTLNLVAQDFDKTSLIKTTTTIAPGIGSSTERFYLHGHLEYYPADKISLRGDSYFNVGSNVYLDEGANSVGRNSGFIEKTHSMFFGALYHLGDKKTFDPYIGFQPGMAFSKPDYNSYPSSPTKTYKTTVSPLMSITAGANYFVGKHFNFFASGQYIMGKATGDGSFYVSLNELRISAGLGFNLNLKREFGSVEMPTER